MNGSYRCSGHVNHVGPDMRIEGVEILGEDNLTFASPFAPHLGHRQLTPAQSSTSLKVKWTFNHTKIYSSKIKNKIELINYFIFANRVEVHHDEIIF